MSVCYAAVTGIKSGGSNEAGYNSVKVTSVSTKALSFYVSLEETASFFVIVFGKQLQWGFVTGGSLGNKTVTLPITATSQIVNVHNTHATNSAGASAGDNNDSVVVLSNSQISVRTDHSDKNAYWLVLCY